MLAHGVAEAQRINETFATPEDAADFWAEGTTDQGETVLSYPGGDGAARAARLYPGGGAGTLLFIHGGGWAGGSIALNHRACRHVAAQSGWDVLSISYRLAPGHPFPAGLEDCRSALRQLRARTDRPIALGGASAGGNLALATALAEDTPLACLVLFYPVCGSDFATDSYRRYGDGFGLTRARMQQLFDMYDPDARHRDNPLCVPLAADLGTLPRAMIISAECDVLADDSRALAARLPDAIMHIEPGVTHGFINRGRLIQAADTCLVRAATFLREQP